MSRHSQSVSTEEIRRVASAWVARLDAGVTASEEAAWRAWLAADPRHREVYEGYTALWGRLDRPRSAGAATRLQRDVILAGRARRRARSRAAGAVAVLVLLFGSVWWTHGPGTEVEAPAGLVAITRPERRVLPDGTVLECPAGTEVTVDFSAPGFRRIALARGDLHLEVASDPLRPLVVSAAGVVFRAVGTTFAVQLRGGAVELLVTEGKVAVESPAPAVADGAAAPLVTAGQSLLVRTPGNVDLARLRPEPCAPAEMGRRLAWRGPRAEFADVPLREVVAALNGFGEGAGGPRYVIGEAELAATRLTGLFRADDPGAFIGILEGGFGVVAERRGPRDIVLRRRP